MAKNRTVQERKLNMDPAINSIISWPIVLMILLFLIMILIPFFIALLELFKPKDNQPLYIDMQHLKDPFYFGSSFKKIFFDSISQNGFPENCSEIKLSKKEIVETRKSLALPPKSRMNNLLYVQGDMEIGEKSIFSKEVYAEGKCSIGNKSVIRSLYSENDIYIGNQVKVGRWVYSENNISILANSKLGRNIACKGHLTLGRNCKFVSLFGNPIITLNGNGEIDYFIYKGFDYPETRQVKRDLEWVIFRKHLSVNCTNDCDDENSQYKRDIEAHFKVNGSYIRTQHSSIVEPNFISRKNLEIGRNNIIYGSIKCYRDISIGQDTLVYGNIFAEGNINIDENCILLGNVFSQAGIFIKKNVKISRPGCIKSIIGKKRVEMGKDVVVFGYVLTEGEGIING